LINKIFWEKKYVTREKPILQKGLFKEFPKRVGSKQSIQRILDLDSGSYRWWASRKYDLEVGMVWYTRI